MTQTGVLICGHGSRDDEAVREFELLAAALRPRFPDYDFATGYLEFARPNIRDGLGDDDHPDKADDQRRPAVDEEEMDPCQSRPRASRRWNSSFGP